MPSPTVEQWLRQAATTLPQMNALNEARALLLAVLNKPSSWIYTHDQQPLQKEQLQQLEQALQRRRQGVPLAYIRGYKAFWDMELQVTPDVLCPRPETELLVETCLEKIKPLEQPEVVDLGTGSGAIALALARACPKALITGTDASLKALRVAQHNGLRWAPQVHWLQMSWLEGLCGPVDVLVSNPPYIAPDDLWLTSDGTRQEPRQALVAQQAGMADLLQIIQQAGSRLNKGGWLMLEHGHDQQAPVQQAMKKAGFQQVETRLDLAGLPRVTLGCWTDSVQAVQRMS